MRILTTAAVACTVLATVLAAVPAVAEDQVLDFSTIPCHVFTDYNKDNKALVVTYLEAYYLGNDDPPILNFSKMRGDVEKLLKYCQANPDAGLITAADKLMDKDKNKN